VNILLVRPPFTRLRGVGQAPYFPIGIGSIAAALEASGFDVHLYYPENAPKHEIRPVVHKAGVFHNRRQAHQRYLAALHHSTHPCWEEWRQVLREIEPDVIGFSVLTPEVGAARVMSQTARALLPSVRIIWGGVHPTFLPNECLDYPEVDAVVRGEGEHSMVELCRRLSSAGDLSQIPGVSSRQAGATQHQPCPPLIEHLDTLALPARHLTLFSERFAPAAWGTVMTSRGCPWRCGFCSSRVFWQKIVRFRSAESVVDEIQHVQQRYGTRNFTFWDDAFTLDIERAAALCQLLLSRNARISWRTATRLDLITPPLLKLMKRSGCTQVEVGIESGSPRMLRDMKKDIDLDKVADAISMVAREGIACGTFFMAGFPSETLADLQQTRQFMERIKPAEIVLNVFDPMPGSDHYAEAQALNLLPDTIDWSDFPLWPDHHYVKHIPREQFDQALEDMASYVFTYNRSPRALLKRVLPEAVMLLQRDPLTLIKKIARQLHRK